MKLRNTKIRTCPKHHCPLQYNIRRSDNHYFLRCPYDPDLKNCPTYNGPFNPDDYEPYKGTSKSEEALAYKLREQIEDDDIDYLNI